MIFIENLATLAAVPLWLWLSMRIGKHRALIAAALWLAVLSLPLALLREGDTGMLIALIAVRGSSFASILFLANSINDRLWMCTGSDDGGGRTISCSFSDHEGTGCRSVRNSGFSIRLIGKARPAASGRKGFRSLRSAYYFTL